MLPTIATGNVGSALAGEYEVANSLRFNDGSSDYLSKTFGSAGNQQIMTISFWMKRSDLSGTKEVISQGTGSACHLNFQSSGTLEMNLRNSVNGGSNVFLITSRLFRDVSAWYHIVLALDTTQGTASNRAKLYVNGVQETSFGTENYPGQNGNLFFNEASAMQIGEDTGGSNFNFDGYLTEFVFIDGQQLTPTSFGEFDEDTGIWKPIDVSGLTFGTNGFYLDFENSGSLGADVSGNGNNFTVNNLTSIDQSTDTCTNNFATFNALSKNDSGTITFSNGNLTTAHSGSDSVYSSYSTIGVSSGKWYTEFKVDASANPDVMTGIGSDVEERNRTGGYLGSSSGTWGYDSTDGSIYNNGSSSSYGNSYANGDIIGIALDLDNNKLYFSKNGTFQNSGDPTSGATGTGAISITANETYFMCCGHASTTTRTSTYSANFGSPPFSISSGNSDGNGYGNFEYAVPSGYYALNSKNLSEYG